jgi:hypothetical protein
MNAATISFDAAKHIYTVNGRVLPSVTQILKVAGLTDDWDNWRSQAREAAMRRGRIVHAACHYLDENALDWESVKPEYQPYVRAWQRFREDVRDFVIQDIEKPVASPDFLYAGMMDRNGVIGTGKQFVVVDIKTSSSKTVPEWTRLQTVAYAVADKPDRVCLRAAVVLGPDGTYRWHEYPQQTWREDFADFLAACRVARWRAEQARTNGA